MRIGLGLGDIGGAPADIDGIVAQARRAEADGFASGWLAQIMGIDAITEKQRQALGSAWPFV